jgi:SAM-dependent methyltransferase
MHQSSLRHMRRLADTYLADRPVLTVADLGSCDVNGSYRPLFTRPGWRYPGVDLAPGSNVDCVLDSPYRLPFATGSLDVFVSGQAFEHVEFFWLTWLEMARVLKPGGLIFLIAPSRGPEHRYPVDCWRFYPDAYGALAKYAALDLLEAGTDWQPDAAEDSAAWGDTVGVFRKRPQGLGRRLVGAVARQLRYLVMPGYR